MKLHATRRRGMTQSGRSNYYQCFGNKANFYPWTGNGKLGTRM